MHLAGLRESGVSSRRGGGGFLGDFKRLSSIGGLLGGGPFGIENSFFCQLSEPVGFEASIASGDQSQGQDEESPFFNPVWLFSLFFGCLGVYVAIVVSDDYGPIAFLFGVILAALGLFRGFLPTRYARH